MTVVIAGVNHALKAFDCKELGLCRNDQMLAGGQALTINTPSKGGLSITAW
jgi:hypothetical protein